MKNQKELIKDFLIPLESYDVCINDRIIFRKDPLDAENCPKCD